MRRALAALGCVAVLNGCAGAGLVVAGAGTGVAMGTGVEHTMSGITYKTFTAPLQSVRFATLKTFDKMGMKLGDDAVAPEGWKLTATASERLIEVELEKLTESATRMRVVANKGEIFFKDSATATEIILQTAQALEASNARPVRQASTKGGAK